MTEKLLESAVPRARDDLPSKEAEVFVMPCSIGQQRYWLLEQLFPGNTALNIPLAVELIGPLDIPVLERALNGIVSRHEVLRTSFAPVDGTPKQVIRTEARLHLGVIDLRDVPAEKQRERVEQEIIAEAARPLSPEHAPIFRTVLLRLGPKENILMMTLHHIVCDGWSNGLLVRETGLFYDAFLRGKPAGLPALAFHYADYAIWQQEWVKTPQFQKQLGYWKETLDGDIPALDMPTDYPRRTGQDYTAFIESLLLPVELGDALKRLCVELDVTLFIVLFAAYVTLLYRYTGQTKFMIGTTAANRNRSEIEHLIGLFANPLILRPEVSGEMTFLELAQRLRDHSLNGFAHQEVPFEMILEELQEKRSGSRKPAIQTHFLYQKAFMEAATYGDLTIRPLRSVSPGSTFELTYGIVERPEGIRLQMEYHTALYKKSTIRRLLGHFQRLLEAAVEDPDTPVRELALLTEEERAELEASLSPKKPLPEGGAHPDIDPDSILDDLQSRLKSHFREAAEPHGALIEAPPGAILVVLNRHLRLLPAGIPGGLYLGGVFSEAVPGNALVSGPLDAASPVPLLHTNFVACHREDGKIEILGQAGDFAQINGFRVNLRQVEAFLRHHSDVLEAAAIIFQPPTGKKQLVCYVTPKPDSTPSEKELGGFLKGKIGDFALPTRILTVASLPRDENGDVAAELLTEPVSSPESIQDESATPLEAILYQQIMDIWKEILKVPSLTIEDNFFTLGGSSLLAFRMMLRIEKLCGRPLPLSLLLTGATIMNLARFIVEANKESASPLVTVQPKGDRTPLFFLHGDWSGGGFYCGRLSRQLGENQPFYAIPPYRSGKQSLLTMEEMASYHVAAIQEHTPHGPYILGGYCIGATVAMEVARQLVEKEEKVSHLLLIDPPLWGTPWVRWVWPFFDKGGGLLKWDAQKKFYSFDHYGVPIMRWLRKPLRGKFLSLCRRLGLARRGNSPAITSAREAGDADLAVRGSLDYAIYFLAYSFYTVRPLSAPATLYFPGETSTSRLSWTKYARKKATANFTIEMLPGNHITSITQYSSELGGKMKKMLDKL